jgi:hypothetical protein
MGPMFFGFRSGFWLSSFRLFQGFRQQIDAMPDALVVVGVALLPSRERQDSGLLANTCSRPQADRQMGRKWPLIRRHRTGYITLQPA